MGKHLSKEEFIKVVREKYHEPFEILEYNGTSKRGRYKCGLCKKEFSIYRMGVLIKDEREHFCPKCWQSSHAQELFDLIKEKDDLTFIQTNYDYSNMKPTIIFRCNRCEQINEKPYWEFLKYPKCIYCGPGAKKLNTIGFKLNLNPEFELLEEYKNETHKVLFRHQCGFIFKAAPQSIVSGHTYCPKCSAKASKGERKIMEILSKNNIAFEKEKVFEWSNLKRYDFFLPEQNLLIEYHGSQHYKETNYFAKTLREQRENDRWKENAARAHGYDYLIIPYDKYKQIEDILVQRLSLTGVENNLETESTSAGNAGGKDIV